MDYIAFENYNFLINDDGEISEQSTQNEFRRSNKDTLISSIAIKLRQGVETAKREFERQQIIFTHHELKLF